MRGYSRENDNEVGARIRDEIYQTGDDHPNLLFLLRDLAPNQYACPSLIRMPTCVASCLKAEGRRQEHEMRYLPLLRVDGPYFNQDK